MGFGQAIIDSEDLTPNLNKIKRITFYSIHLGIYVFEQPQQCDGARKKDQRCFISVTSNSGNLS